MKLFSVIFAATAVLSQLAAAKSWINTYDIGLHGLYPTNNYVSFGLQSPKVDIQRWDSRCDNDYILLTPRGKSVKKPGPIILDARGNLIWMEDRFGEVMDMKMQSYNGEDFLTFWVGTDDGTHGRGVYYMLNSSYDIAHEVKAVGGLEGDLHEFKLTETGTALMTIYEITSADLSSLGIESGWIYDCLIQEVDLATGELLFQWRSSDHYQVDETFQPIGNKGKDKDTAFDYFHINSISKDPDGNYYISSRYMHTVTCISPTGSIVWILGGKRNQFIDLSDGAATNFTWQHHADWHTNNIITIFDNGATDSIKTADFSRGLKISLDLVNMTATLLDQYVSPQKFLSASQGSVQILPETENVFVGWGHSAAYTEFTADGQMLCNVHFGASLFFENGRVKSYRAFKSPWIGRPNTLPDVKMQGSGNVFVSWNGATEVKSWSLQGIIESPEGEGVESVEIQRLEKIGFETRFDVNDQTNDYFRIAALDLHGEVLGYSRIIEKDSEKAVSDKFEPLEDDEDESVSIHPLVVLCGFLVGAWLIWTCRRPLLESVLQTYYRAIASFRGTTGFQRIPSSEIDLENVPIH